jgi:hypothetical protein
MGDDGILRVAFVGEMGQDEWRAYFQEIQPYVEAAVADGRQLPTVIDVRRAGKLQLEARKTIANISDQPDVLKVAVVGVSRYVRVLANFLSKARGRGEANLFGSEEEAVAWLRSTASSAAKEDV